jgi:hypothetical protein
MEPNEVLNQGVTGDLQQFAGAGADLDRAKMWNSVVSFLGMEIFGQEVFDRASRYQPKIAAPSEKETPINVALDEWEWRLFRTSSGIKDYIRKNSAFMQGQMKQEFSRAAMALGDLFWAVVSLGHKDLWGKSLGVRVQEDRLILVEIPETQGSSLPSFLTGLLSGRPE